MIKRTLYFGSPAYLSMKDRQLCIRKPEDEKADNASSNDLIVKTVPIEDVGFVILDSPRITLTNALVAELLDNNVALISCGASHIPSGLMMPLSGNTIQQERFRQQLESSLPLRKQLWQQTVAAKISNQAAVLKHVTGQEHRNMKVWAGSVKSGDTDNLEARAAVYYWKTLFPEDYGFVRDVDGGGVNGILNYGYAILRGIIARALTGSGLLPILGIHHHNRYNAYCLADDIMEPYRPYIDKLVVDIISDNPRAGISKEVKIRLLEIPTMEVVMEGKRSPLMIAASRTSASLAKCFSGELRKISYPAME